MIAVTFALPAESSNFIKLLSRRSQEGGLVRGTFLDVDVCVLHTGVGEQITRRRMSEFLERLSPGLLVSSGFAGALTDQLVVGDILLADNYSAPEPLAKARRLLSPTGLHVGKLFTAAAIIDSATHRAEFARKSGSLAVDMETRFIAEACSRFAIPMLSLRAISDSPSAPMPAPPEVMFDIERQQTRFVTLALHVAKNPAALPKLARFGKQIAGVRGALTDALATFLKAQ